MSERKKKPNLTKWVWTVIVVLINLIIWAIPSDLAYNIAQQREILLGRYTIDQTTTLIVVAVISIFILMGIWSNREKKAEREKTHRFKIIALLISIVIPIVAFDIFLRTARNKQYLKSQSFYYRVPNTIQHGVNKDIPPTFFSYPRTPAGYPDLDYTLTVDEIGFRNSSNLNSYDIVVLGDSFTEGSHVSDDHAWPALLAEKCNCTVYNLGMSSGNPVTYLDVFKTFGLDLSPKTVICMLYEGNDFRGANFEKRKKTGRLFELKNLLYNSPLRHGIRRILIRYLGPINKNRFNKNTHQHYSPSHPLYAVSWLPIGIPDGPDAKFYAFKIKKLLEHFESKDTFLTSKGCQQTFKHLSEIKNICNNNNIRLIVVYAPDKPHTLIPLIKDNINAHQFHAFMALKEKNLPPAESLMEILLDRLDVQEYSVEAFCHDEGIEFVSLTEPLRKSIAEGLQAYYTYDQHWTPVGNEVAAETLSNYLKNQKDGAGTPITNR